MDAKNHHAIEELNAVHAKMIAKYKMGKNTENQARQMELFLRAVKRAANPKKWQNRDVNTAAFQDILELEGLDEIVEATQQALGNNHLFTLRHRKADAINIAKQFGGDDIVEVQLQKLLQIAGEKTQNNSSQPINLGVAIIGQVKGNTIQNVEEVQRSAENLIKDMMKNAPEKAIKASIVPSEIIKTPTARAAKVDVIGFNANFDIESEIKPEWQKIISSFKNVHMSVKNYASKTQNPTETIHLGNTNPFKAVYGLLSTLGFSSVNAQHIYIHSRISYLFGYSASQGEGPEHILHMRFTYELTGSGLYDENGKKLDEVDFFVYNDPDTENIYVRSVQNLIQNICHSMDASALGDPWNSSVVILKNTF